jgi:hypothetical protein
MKSLDMPIDRMDRNLATLECSYGAGPENHFTVQIEITPRGGENITKCSSDLQKSIGALISVVLDDYGFGEAGNGDSAVFSADICEVPSLTLNRRRLARRFSWSGGGTCTSCRADNKDGRKLGDKDDATWFPKTYAPELKKKLTKAISKALPSTSRSCLGSSPIVNVNIQQVPAKPAMTCGSN